MSSGCGDVLSLADLQTAKKHQIFEAEVITGKSGGVAGGADIDYATNQVTGQTQKTLPAVLRDLWFSPVSWDFLTGGTLTATDRDKVVYDPVSKTWYSYAGALPVTVPAGFNPVGNADWKPQTDPNLRDDLLTGEILNTLYAREFNTVADMAASTHLQIGEYVRTNGFYTAGDGGGAEYVMTLEAPNGFTNIACAGGITAKLLVRDNTLDIRQAGAKNDGTGPVKATDGNYLFRNAAKAIKRQQTINGDVWSLDKSVLSYVKASPDSSTDNGPAIRAALQVADVITGEGSYKITGKIELDSFKTVKGTGLFHIYCDYVNPASNVYTDDIFTNSDHDNGNENIAVVNVVTEGNARYFSSSEMLAIKAADTYPNFYPGSGVKFDNVQFGEVQIIGLFGMYGVSIGAGGNYNIHDCLTMYHNDDGITLSMNNSTSRGMFDSKGSTISRCTSLVNGFGAFASTGIEIDDTTGFVTISDCVCAGNSAGFDVHFHRNLDDNPTLQRYQSGIVFKDCIAFDNNCDPSLVTSDSTWVHNVGFRTGVSYGNYGISFIRCHSNGHWNNEYGFTGSSNMERSRVLMQDCRGSNPSSSYLSHYTVKSTVYAKFGVSLTIRGGDYDGGLQICVRGENAHSISILDRCVLRRAMGFVDATFHSSYNTDITSGLIIDNSVLQEHYTSVTDRQGVRCTSGGYNIALTNNVMAASTVALAVAYLYLYGAPGAKIRVQNNTCIRSGAVASQGRFLQILTPNTKLHESNNTVVNFDMDLHWTAATGSTIMRSGQILESTPNATFPSL